MSPGDPTRLSNNDAIPGNGCDPPGSAWRAPKGGNLRGDLAGVEASPLSFPCTGRRRAVSTITVSSLNVGASINSRAAITMMTGLGLSFSSTVSQYLTRAFPLPNRVIRAR
jgi:hypothetical protein